MPNVRNYVTVEATADVTFDFEDYEDEIVAWATERGHSVGRDIYAILDAIRTLKRLHPADFEVNWGPRIIELVRSNYE